jgi:23S rRNA pseudouridine1911/1915/1917 synthase
MFEHDANCKSSHNERKVKTLTLSARIPRELAGERLDLALSRLFAEHSRSLLRRWIEAGSVAVDGTVAKRGRDRVHGGERVRIVAEMHERGHDQAEDIPLRILHEDEHILVLNKPAGLVVHPGAGNATGTLLNALLHHCPDSAALPRAGLVHRIDKDTSGALVVAKTLQAQTELSSRIARHEVERSYLAVVHGCPAVAGRVDAPIARHPHQRTRMAVRERGRHAVTHYRRTARYRHHALLRLRLETGRTHQIRLHLAHLGHPIVGDRDYGGVRPAGADLGHGLCEVLAGFDRQALHARRLRLDHPASGEALCFDAPVPGDMARLVAALAADSRAGDPA